jgi:hypothetical protein
MSRRLSFTEKRRRRLATFRAAEIERFEARSTVTPIGLAAFSLGAGAVAAELGAMHANGGVTP